MFEVILLLVALIGLILASINDIKTREVPDYLSYFLISIAIVLRLLWFVKDGDLRIISWVPASFALFVGLSYLMYVGGQWGGGDVKLLAGLSILLSWFPSSGYPFFTSLFMNILIAGVLYGFISMLFLGIWNYKKMIKHFNKFDKFFLPISLISLILLFTYLNILIATMISLLIILGVLLRYSKIIEKNILQRKVPIKQLTEGDWILKPVRYQRKIIVPQRKIGLIREDLLKLKKYSKLIDGVTIKMGIPFVPAFLMAFLMTLLWGNVLLELVNLLVSTI